MAINGATVDNAVVLHHRSQTTVQPVDEVAEGRTLRWVQLPAGPHHCMYIFSRLRPMLHKRYDTIRYDTACIIDDMQ